MLDAYTAFKAVVFIISMMSVIVSLKKGLPKIVYAFSGVVMAALLVIQIFSPLIRTKMGW